MVIPKKRRYIEIVSLETKAEVDQEIAKKKEIIEDD